jgi:hypothetical protein
VAGQRQVRLLPVQHQVVTRSSGGYVAIYVVGTTAVLLLTGGVRPAS